VRLEIEDNKGFKWVLRVGTDRGWGGKRATLLMHSHANWLSREPSDGAEYLCMYYYDSENPNQPIDERRWTCGSCSHEVPPEVVEYYNTVKWGLDTMMFDDEDDVL
jgi:hypothetical protein